MADTNKPMSEADMEQAIKYAFNDQDRTIAVGTFVAAQVGHKIEVTYPSAAVEHYTYMNGADTLYVLEVTYTDLTKTDLLSVERIS